MDVVVKAKYVNELAHLAFSLVLEDIQFNYNSRDCILTLELENPRWVFSHLVNLKLRDIDFVKIDGIKYDYMGIEL